jgi:repressor LexA
LKNRIKELREEKGVKQIDLAKYLNVSQATLSNWERDVFNLDKESLLMTADFFGTTTDYILGRTGSTPYGADGYGTVNGGENSAGVTNTADKNTQKANNNPLAHGSPPTAGLFGGYSPEEAELCRIYRSLDVKGRHKLMSVAFDLEAAVRSS